MRSELFVDLLGYKESNLINLMRCKGKCEEAAVECGPTVVHQKRVNMIIKTKLSGRDPQVYSENCFAKFSQKCEGFLQFIVSSHDPQVYSENCFPKFSQKSEGFLHIYFPERENRPSEEG